MRRKKERERKGDRKKTKRADERARKKADRIKEITGNLFVKDFSKTRRIWYKT